MDEINPNKGSERKLKIAIGVISFMALSLGILYIKELKNNQKNLQLNISQAKEILSANTQLDSIGIQLSNKIKEIQTLGGDVSELVLQKQKLIDDKALLADSEHFTKNKFDQKIKEYIKILNKKDSEIRQLNIANGLLTAQNDSLSKQTKSLYDEIQTTQKALNDSLLKVRQANLKVKEVEAINKGLSEKVNLALALKAENINVYAISPKGKQKEASTYRSDKVEKIRITFYLAHNPIAEKEHKTIYLKILDPQGATLSDMANGSGVFAFKNKEYTYTAKQKIFFDDTHQTIEFIYSRGVAYKEGKHIVELYAEGIKIGEGFFEVK
ncbi:MAG: hypothetical protein KA313_02075 [Pseudarcicella sp.]|nr:hypothetical protein [Pseudarcicella sp.]MBP6409866.1 hypothetical protein [Pseudarcicella sp.]